MKKTLPGVKSVCCELKVRTTGTTRATFLSLRGKSGGGNYTLIFVFQGGNSSVEEIGPGIGRTVGTIAELPTWTKLKIQASFGPNATKGAFKYSDGTVALTDTLGNTTDDLTFTEIDLGVVSSSPSDAGSGRSIFFDDVSCGTK